METDRRGDRLHYEGVLEKAGKRFFEGFRKRWFILDGKNLSYYKASETTAENLLGIIDLTKVKAVVPSKMLTNNAFQIITSMRTYTFSAATPLLMTEWISVLRQAMQVESFNNKRGKASIRGPSDRDLQSPTNYDQSYEEVSTLPGLSSEPANATDDDDLYEQVGATNSETQSESTCYESVGEVIAQSGTDSHSISRINLPADNDLHSQETPSTTSDMYATVNKSGSLPRSSEDIVLGNVKSGSQETTNKNELVLQETPLTDSNMYATVNKPRSLPRESIPEPDDDNMYTEVGTYESAKASQSDPMSIICESDDDEDDEHDDVNQQDDADIDEDIESIKDPLPPPHGEHYAIDQIKLLLKDFNNYSNNDKPAVAHERINELSSEDDVVPEKSEKAFDRLKEFLQQMESK